MHITKHKDSGARYEDDIGTDMQLRGEQDARCNYSVPFKSQSARKPMRGGAPDRISARPRAFTVREAFFTGGL